MDINPITGLPYNNEVPMQGSTPNTGSPIQEPINPITKLPYNYGNTNYNIPVGKPGSIKTYNIPDVESYTKRGVVLNPNYDTKWNDLRAERQTWGDQIMNGFAKMNGLATTTFIGTFTDLLFAAPNIVQKGKFSGLYDNPINHAFDEFGDWMEKTFPNYYTQKELDAPAFSKANLLSSNFIGDKMLKNMGFSIGALGSAIVMGYLTGGTGSVATMSRIASWSAKLGKMAAAVKEGSAFIRPTAKILESVANANKLFRLTKGANLVWDSFNASHYEAGMEARLMGKQLEEQLRAKGIYSESTIEEMVDKAMNGNFLLNTALLSIGNAIQFGKLFNAGFKTEKNALNKILLNDVKNEFVEAKPSWVSRNKTILASPLVEGHEEAAQFGIENQAYSYWNKEVDPNDTVNEHIASWIDGINKTFGTKEGQESMLLGALTGLLFGGTVNTIFNKAQGTTGKSISQSTQTAISELMQAMNNDPNGFIATSFNKIKDTHINAVKGIENRNDKLKALKENDIFAYKNAEAKDFYNLVRLFSKYGMYDTLRQKFVDVGALSSEEFDKLAGEKEQGQTTFMNKLLTRADFLNKTYEQLQYRFPTAKNWTRKKGDKLEVYNLREELYNTIASLSDIEGREEELANEVSMITSGIIDWNTLSKLVDDTTQEQSLVDESRNTYRKAAEARKAIEDQKDKLTPEEYNAKIEEHNTKIKSLRTKYETAVEARDKKLAFTNYIRNAYAEIENATLGQSDTKISTEQLLKITPDEKGVSELENKLVDLMKINKLRTLLVSQYEELVTGNFDKKMEEAYEEAAKEYKVDMTAKISKMSLAELDKLSDKDKKIFDKAINKRKTELSKKGAATQTQKDVVEEQGEEEEEIDIDKEVQDEINSLSKKLQDDIKTYTQAPKGITLLDIVKKMDDSYIKDIKDHLKVHPEFKEVVDTLVYLYNYYKNLSKLQSQPKSKHSKNPKPNYIPQELYDYIKEHFYYSGSIDKPTEAKYNMNYTSDKGDIIKVKATVANKIQHLKNILAKLKEFKESALYKDSANKVIIDNAISAATINLKALQGAQTTQINKPVPTQHVSNAATEHKRKPSSQAEENTSGNNNSTAVFRAETPTKKLPNGDLLVEDEVGTNVENINNLKTGTQVKITTDPTHPDKRHNIETRNKDKKLIPLRIVTVDGKFIGFYNEGNHIHKGVKYVDDEGKVNTWMNVILESNDIQKLISDNIKALEEYVKNNGRSDKFEIDKELLDTENNTGVLIDLINVNRSNNDGSKWQLLTITEQFEAIKHLYSVINFQGSTELPMQSLGQNLRQWQNRITKDINNTNAIRSAIKEDMSIELNGEVEAVSVGSAIFTTSRRLIKDCLVGFTDNSNVKLIIPDTKTGDVFYDAITGELVKHPISNRVHNIYMFVEANNGQRVAIPLSTGTLNQNFGKINKETNKYNKEALKFVSTTTIAILNRLKEIKGKYNSFSTEEDIASYQSEVEELQRELFELYHTLDDVIVTDASTSKDYYKVNVYTKQPLSNDIEIRVVEQDEDGSYYDAYYKLAIGKTGNIVISRGVRSVDNNGKDTTIKTKVVEGKVHYNVTKWEPINLDAKDTDINEVLGMLRKQSRIKTSKDKTSLAPEESNIDGTNYIDKITGTVYDKYDSVELNYQDFLLTSGNLVSNLGYIVNETGDKLSNINPSGDRPIRIFIKTDLDNKFSEKPKATRKPRTPKPKAEPKIESDNSFIAFKSSIEQKDIDIFNDVYKLAEELGIPIHPVMLTNAEAVAIYNKGRKKKITEKFLVDNGVGGFYSKKDNVIYLLQQANGFNSYDKAKLIAHEIYHGIIQTKVKELSKEKIREISDKLKTWYKDVIIQINKDQQSKTSKLTKQQAKGLLENLQYITQLDTLSDDIDITNSTLDELIAHIFTNKELAKVLSKLDSDIANKEEGLIDKLIKLFKEIISAISNKLNRFDELVDITNEIFRDNNIKKDSSEEVDLDSPIPLFTTIKVEVSDNEVQDRINYCK